MAGNQALWTDVARDLAAAEKACLLAVERAESLEQHGAEMAPDVRFDRELAVGTLLHDAYCAMEAGLERLVEAVDGDRPKGRDYHAQLVQRAASAVESLRPAMISAVTAKDLHVLRSFRHVVRHSYGEFDYGRAAPNVEVARRVVAAFTREITGFARAVGITG